MAENQWHLDKKVPLALILALLMQTAAGAWWAASMQARIAQVERSFDAQAAEVTSLGRRLDAEGRQVAVLVSRLGDTNASLADLRDQVAETNSLIRDLLREQAGGGR